VYRSDAFYQVCQPTLESAEGKAPEKINLELKGMNLPTYKTYSAQFFNLNRLRAYLGQNPSLSPKDVSIIRANLRTERSISARITPVYAYSKDELRQLATGNEKQNNAIIGLNLFSEADSPQGAATSTRFLADYIRDCTMFVVLNDYIQNGLRESISSLAIEEKVLSRIRFDIKLNENKLLAVRAILNKYPAAARIEYWQLVSVQADAYRYLPPIAQLIGIESKLTDLSEYLARSQRRKDEFVLLEEYFSRCASELNDLKERGEAVLGLLRTAGDAVFGARDLNQDAVRDAYTSLSDNVAFFEYVFNSHYHFISGPRIPPFPIASKRLQIIVLSSVISFTVLAVFALALHWWRENRRVITHSISYRLQKPHRPNE
jgi:hypothetical protein